MKTTRHSARLNPVRAFAMIALALPLVGVSTACLSAAEEAMKPEATEVWKPVPPMVGPRATDGRPPKGALILFGGTGMDEWVDTNTGKTASWPAADGVFTVNKKAGNIETRRSFRDYQLHIEWRVPKVISGSGQGRGNSGLFLASTGKGDDGYELQILDPWHNPTYVNGMAGSIYKQHIPKANPGRPPGEWNVYDVVWTAPRFTADGKLKSPARVTARWNGVLVQDNVALKGPTQYIGLPRYKAHGRSPIKLQAHGDPSEPISFRNIWLVETGSR